MVNNHFRSDLLIFVENTWNTFCLYRLYQIRLNIDFQNNRNLAWYKFIKRENIANIKIVFIIFRGKLKFLMFLMLILPFFYQNYKSNYKNNWKEYNMYIITNKGIDTNTNLTDIKNRILYFHVIWVQYFR